MLLLCGVLEFKIAEGNSDATAARAATIAQMRERGYAEKYCDRSIVNLVTHDTLATVDLPAKGDSQIRVEIHAFMD